MVVFTHRCTDHGDAEVSRPTGMVTVGASCRVCGQAAAQMDTAPELSLGSSARRALIDRTERTRAESAVVSAPPPRQGSAAVARAGPAPTTPPVTESLRAPARGTFFD
jgi:hypothetical protein